VNFLGAVRAVRTRPMPAQAQSLRLQALFDVNAGDEESDAGSRFESIYDAATETSQRRPRRSRRAPAGESSKKSAHGPHCSRPVGEGASRPDRARRRPIPE